jgi:hypothetical protein
MGRIGGRVYVVRCSVCRRRKVKVRIHQRIGQHLTDLHSQCDGKKPSCETCIRSGRTCLGYERQLEFAHFDGQSKENIEARQSGKNASSAIPRVADAAAGFRRQHVDHGNQFLVLPFSPGNLAVPQYKAGFVAVLNDRYLPEEPKVGTRGEAVCAGWIATACNLSSFEAGKDSDMLSNSLLAMALTFAGAERKDPNICAAGLRHYSNALSGLRLGLANGPRALSAYQVDTSLITCLACAMYEVGSFCLPRSLSLTYLR